MPWQLPRLCVVAYWSLITHVVYLAHVAATEHYSDQSKCVFKYFNVRYDFTSVHPLLLEWVHTFETAFVIGLAAHACGGRAAAVGCAAAAAFGLLGCCRVACKDAATRLFGRRARAGALIAAGLTLAPPALDAAVARAALLTAHAHAIVAPSNAAARLLAVDGAERGAAVLLALHAAALALGDAALRRPGAGFALLSAAFVGVAREVALACDRRWPRARAPTLRGAGATHALADLFPPTPLDAALPRRGDGGDEQEEAGLV